ncbi:hypothetical protein [Paenibacillus tianmuensis]|nr:hypothetical protein [Paenibacillus tianmuensis]
MNNAKQVWRRTVSLLLASLLFAFQWAGSRQQDSGGQRNRCTMDFQG